MLFSEGAGVNELQFLSDAPFFHINMTPDKKYNFLSHLAQYIVWRFNLHSGKGKYDFDKDSAIILAGVF